MIKKQHILFFMVFLYSDVSFGMKVDNSAKKEQAVQTKKSPPISLYNYFGISNGFAGTACKDIKERLTKAVMQTGRWWYVRALLGDKTIAPERIVYSPDGSMIATTCADNALRVWNQKGEVTACTSYALSISGLVSSPNEPLLIVSLDKKTASDEQQDTAALLKVDFKGTTLKAVKDSNNPRVLAINSQGTHICTTATRNVVSLKVWPLGGGIPTYIHIPSSLMAFCQDGTDYVAVANNKLELHQYEGDHGTVTYVTDHDVGIITAVAVHPQGSFCATGGDNGTITLWDKVLQKQKILICEACDARNAKGHSVSLLAFAPHGKHLVAVNHNNILVFEVARGQELSRVRHNSIVKSLAFCPGRKKQFAVACDGSHATVWEYFTEITFEQMLLRLVLKEHIARCILEHKEPLCPTEKQQASDDGFIAWMGHEFNIKIDSIKNVWRTLPEQLRKSIIRTYVHRVEKVKALPAVRALRVREQREQEYMRMPEDRKIWHMGSFGANW